MTRRESDGIVSRDPFVSGRAQIFYYIGQPSQTFLDSLGKLVAKGHDAWVVWVLPLGDVLADELPGKAPAA